MVAMAAMVVVGGACGRDERSGSGPGGVSEPVAESVTAMATASTASTVVATTQAMTEEQQVLAAYEESWRIWIDANDPPNPNHPGIAEHFQGTSRDRLLKQIESNLASGLSFRLPKPSQISFRPETVAVQGSTAVLVGCVVDDGLVVDTVSGAVVNDRVVARRVRASLVQEEGRWKLSDEVYLHEWIGADRCDD
jgi:hypothetical protein